MLYRALFQGSRHNTNQKKLLQNLLHDNSGLVARYGNTRITSNADGTFQLNHGAGISSGIVLARFGSASSNYITFGGNIDANAAYGVVHSSDGVPLAVNNIAILWVVIGFN